MVTFLSIFSSLQNATKLIQSQINSLSVPNCVQSSKENWIQRKLYFKIANFYHLGKSIATVANRWRRCHQIQTISPPWFTSSVIYVTPDGRARGVHRVGFFIRLAANPAYSGCWHELLLVRSLRGSERNRMSSPAGVNRGWLCTHPI